MIAASTLIKRLDSNSVVFSLADGKLKIDAPIGVLSNEVKELLRSRKNEIIKYLKMITMRDFCGVCQARLFELPNGEWLCPTIGCTDSRLRTGVNRQEKENETDNTKTNHN